LKSVLDSPDYSTLTRLKPRSANLVKALLADDDKRPDIERTLQVIGWNLEIHTAELNLQYPSMNTSTIPIMEDFKECLISIGVPADRIDVFGIRPGSILIDFAIREPDEYAPWYRVKASTSTDRRSSSTILADLQNQLISRSFGSQHYLLTKWVSLKPYSAPSLRGHSVGQSIISSSSDFKRDSSFIDPIPSLDYRRSLFARTIPNSRRRVLPLLARWTNACEDLLTTPSTIPSTEILVDIIKSTSRD
jgi:hypothetical protein